MIGVERPEAQVIQGFHPIYHLRQRDDLERIRRERYLGELLQIAHPSVLSGNEKLIY